MTAQHSLRPHPDVPLTVAEAGSGRPALVLHGGRGLAYVAEEVAHLAAIHRVLTPTHSGFEGTPRPDESPGSTASPRPTWTCSTTST